VFAFADKSLFGAFPPEGVTEDTYESPIPEVVLPFSLMMPFQGKTFEFASSADVAISTLGGNPLLLVRMDAAPAATERSSSKTKDDHKDDEDEEDDLLKRNPSARMMFDVPDPDDLYEDNPFSAKKRDRILGGNIKLSNIGQNHVMENVDFQDINEENDNDE